jgi:hypothetical protein
MVPISQTIIQTYRFGGLVSYDPNCKLTATKRFPMTFPTPFPSGADVRVILKGNDLSVDSAEHNAAVVACRARCQQHRFLVIREQLRLLRGFRGIQLYSNRGDARSAAPRAFDPYETAPAFAARWPNRGGHG